MFSHSQISTLARKAHALTEGSGDGYTIYGGYRARYVVGGVSTRLYAIGTAVPVIRRDILADARTEAVQGAHTVGCWEHEGTVYVDYGTVADNLPFALELARKRGEHSIYDSVTGECIVVDKLAPAVSPEHHAERYSV